MAFVQQLKCHKCGDVTYHTNGRCNDCARKQADAEQKAKDDQWNGMTIEQKLDFLRAAQTSLEKQLIMSDFMR